MRVFFAGTPEFALPSLAALGGGHEIVGVLTQKAAAKGRGRKIVDSPVKAWAVRVGLRVFEPEALDEAFYEAVARLAPDLLVCAAYGKIFKKHFLDLFPGGGVNVHPSLLPRHRGPAPIPAAILAGDSVTGVTIQRLALKMDSGAILAQETLELSGSETAAGLEPVLANLGASLLPGVLSALETGTAEQREQNDCEATYCRLTNARDGELSFRESALLIARMMRAYTPWPLVSTRWKGKRLFFLQGGVYPHQFESGSALPGTVLGMDKEYGILINTCEGVLFVSHIQLECKKPLFWRDFLNGNRDFPGSVCGGTE